MTIDQVRTGLRMLEMRDTLKRVIGDGYAESIEKWKAGIRRVMEREGCGPIPAAIDLMKAAKDTADDGVASLWWTAAAVEILESDH